VTPQIVSSTLSPASSPRDRGVARAGADSHRLQVVIAPNAIHTEQAEMGVVIGADRQRAMSHQTADRQQTQEVAGADGAEPETLVR
jgi:hypothetical protein